MIIALNSNLAGIAWETLEAHDVVAGVDTLTGPSALVLIQARREAAVCVLEDCNVVASAGGDLKEAKHGADGHRT
jgi:hypothetical protein